MPIHKFVLVGPRAGKTENLAGMQFTDGVYHHESKYLKVSDIADLTTYLARCYNAHIEGSAEHREAEEAWRNLKAHGTKQPGSGISVTGRTLSDQEMLAILETLDPEDDTHWAAGGQPGVDAVSQRAGFVVSRKQIAQAAPGFSRDSARALA